MNSFKIYLVVGFILLALNIVNVGFSPIEPEEAPSNQQQHAQFENRSFSEQEVLSMQDGQSETSTMELSSNGSEEGWKLQSIIARITYDESTTGDINCDTVSVELTISGSQGDSPSTANTTDQDDSCTLMVLDMFWPAVNDTNTNHHTAPLIVEVEVELDVNSTVPFNDQDEDVVVEIVVNMSRIKP